MRVFVAIGLAVLLTLIVVGFHAHYCEACCNGRPCNPELYKRLYPEEVKAIQEQKRIKCSLSQGSYIC